MMRSYLVPFVVLLIVISKNVILSNRNDSLYVMERANFRDSEASLEQDDIEETVLTSNPRTEVALGIVSTSYRPVRLNSSSSSAQERDTKLMNLLAARRSALHQDRFRTHSRASATTGRTRASTESTSKSPPDSRTICVRNCTKNFTRRTTASCMRQCTSIARRTNTTANSSNTSKYTSEEEKSQKDTNEILFTDESSHGFFVVAKDANDTMNHIPELRKDPGISSGSVYKTRNKPNPPLQLPDSESYLYFGRKIPSLRPSLLRISTVSGEHPQVFEVSVSQKPTRPKNPNKFNPRERFSPSLSRKFNADKTSSFVSTAQIPAVENISLEGGQVLIQNDRNQSNDKVKPTTTTEVPVLKQITLPIESSTTSLLAKEQLVEAKIVQEKRVEEKPIEEKVFEEKLVEEKLAEEKLRLFEVNPSEVSTPLLISVLNEDETTLSPASENPTEATPVNEANASTEPPKIEAPAHFSEDKTNLIIFVNKSMGAVTPSSMPETTNTSEVLTYIRTTILSSVRSTVHPQTFSRKTATSTSTTMEIPETITDDHNIHPTEMKDGNDAESTKRTPSDALNETKSRLPEESNLTRLKIATYVLAGLGMIPVIVVIVYLAKSLILKEYSKHNEDFDICIADQQPISPVKKIEKYDDEDEESGQYEHCSISSMDEFNRGNLRLKSLLGEGNFGQVWKAEADDLSGHIGATRIVAVKTVRSGSSQDGLKEEATIMRKLGSHANVVTLLGACIESEPHMLIMEFAMRGRLLSLLRAARSATSILPASVPGGKSLAPLSPRTLAGFALDIAAGMEYIAEKRIVHRDLAARNVLIDHNGICKICDFGMSIDLDVVCKNREKKYDAEIVQTTSRKFDKFKFDFGERFINNWSHGFNTHNPKKTQDTLGRRPALPIRWMAPEALQYNEFSIKTDVWAFGIVLWEIATLGSTPYSNLSGREVVRHVLQGTRPELPKDGRHGFYDLMLQCWHKVPELRPTFREARSEISRSVCKWMDEDAATSDYMDVSGFSEDLEHGMVYFNQRISEFECEI